MKKRIGLICIALMAAVCMMAQSNPPADATKETWYINALFTSGGESEDVSEPMDIAYSGEDVYFNFPNPITGNTWMKGTRNGNYVTFDRGQLVGSYGGTKIYYMGVGESGLCDIEFTYNEEAEAYVLGDMWLALTNSLTQANALGYFSPVMITKNAPSSTDDETAYTMTGKNVNPNNEEQYENLNEDVTVTIEGSEVSIQGLSAFDSKVWLKGTLADGIVTCKTRQSAGSYSNTPLFFIGYDGAECDITFSYDEATGVLVAGQYILCVTEAGVTYQMLTDIVLSPKGGSGSTLPEVVTPPAGLQTTPYVFTGAKMLTDEEGNYTGTEEVKYNVRIGFYNNSEVYVQGLCQYLPEAWVVGSIGEEFLGDKPITFAAGQFYGQYGIYPLYMVARYNNGLTNMVYNYDPQTREFTNDGGYFLVLNVMPDQPAPVEMFVHSTMKPGTYNGIETIDNGHSSMDNGHSSMLNGTYDLQGRRVNGQWPMDNGPKGIYIYQGKKIIK